jgi:CRP/FNR family cyclic AMP-dependent transcriptional regulator
MTQTDLAGMVGGSRQSVNQILRSFERRGYLELRGRQIRLKQPELLRRRAHL